MYLGEQLINPTEARLRLSARPGVKGIVIDTRPNTRIQLMLDACNLMRPMAESGRVRVLAVTAAERQALPPGVPTASEAGLPGFVASSWHGFVAPAATPPAIVARLEEAVGAAPREPEPAQALAARGATVRFRDAAAFRAFIAAGRRRWTAVTREAGVTVD